MDTLSNSSELIDVLHHVLLLWEKNQRELMEKRLQDSGFGRKDLFYKVAQAICESLPNSAKEKKLLDGFLARREVLRKKSMQQTFSEYLIPNRKK